MKNDSLSKIFQRRPKIKLVKTCQKSSQGWLVVGCGMRAFLKIERLPTISADQGREALFNNVLVSYLIFQRGRLGVSLYALYTIDKNIVPFLSKLMAFWRDRKSCAFRNHIYLLVL